MSTQSLSERLAALKTGLTAPISITEITEESVETEAAPSVNVEKAEVENNELEGLLVPLPARAVGGWDHNDANVRQALVTIFRATFYDIVPLPVSDLLERLLPVVPELVPSNVFGIAGKPESCGICSVRKRCESAITSCDSSGRIVSFCDQCSKDLNYFALKKLAEPIFKKWQAQLSRVKAAESEVVSFGSTYQDYRLAEDGEEADKLVRKYINGQARDYRLVLLAEGERPKKTTPAQAVSSSPEEIVKKRRGRPKKVVEPKASNKITLDLSDF